MATQPNPALEAAVQAMLAQVSTAAQHASAREALGRKCPRFVPSPGPILPFLSAAAQMRQIVEGLPASVEAEEIPLDDVGVYYDLRKASALEVGPRAVAAQAKAA